MSETPSNVDADNTSEVAAPPQSPAPPTPPATPAVPTPPATPVAPVVQIPAPAPAPAPAQSAQPVSAPFPQATYPAPYSAPESQTMNSAVASPYGTPNMPYAGAPEQAAPTFSTASATKSFFGRLFDMSFSTYITPSFVKLMYILSLIGIWGSWFIYLIFGTFTAGQWDATAGFMTFLGILVLGGLIAFLLTLSARASLEFLIATIKTAENTNRLRELKEEEETGDE